MQFEGISQVFLVFSALCLTAYAESGRLQIGVKKRVDPELCKIKSRKGDSLSMHYTVSCDYKVRSI